MANSHLDPVWLWDWREGMTEALTTIRTMVALMEDYPELTYIRGESLVYEHILREDPATFGKIRHFVKQGRWDVVGGSYLQPDTNLPATETLVRQFAVGRRFFQRHFGRTVEAAWHADSFGHSAGLPEIFHHAGIRYMAFFRPSAAQLPLDSPAFWWQGPGRHRVLAYRPPVAWYGCERHEMPARLDRCLDELKKGGLPLLACFYGLGNHGGGPSRRHVEDIRAWSAAHPEVEVVHSGLHRFFHELEALALHRAPSRRLRFPVHTGELNFCLRGCYAASARIKFPYRQAEAAVARVERSANALTAMLAPPAPATAGNHQAHDDLWRDILFNSFHDILPGSSIQRATDEQAHWLHGTLHRTKQAEYHFLNRLASCIDTSTGPAPEPDMPQAVPLLVFNPHPVTYRGPLEFEAGMDYRPLFAYRNNPDAVPLIVRAPSGKIIPHQKLPVENRFLPDLPWRQRVVVTANIPPMGWAVYTLGLAAASARPAAPARNPFVIRKDSISNGTLAIRARVGGEHIRLTHHGKSFPAAPGLSLSTMEDPWGAWGGHSEEPESLNITAVRHRWKITNVQVIEAGPIRAALRVNLAAGHSTAEIRFDLDPGGTTVQASACVFWHERGARLKLIISGASRALFEVPGGRVERAACGEAPGGRWVWATSGKKTDGFGFASDALYNFNIHDNALGVTLLRAHAYACTGRTDQSAVDDNPPMADKGEYRFRFLLTPNRHQLERLSSFQEEPPYAQTVAPSEGRGGRSGSFFSLQPTRGIRLLAFTPARHPGQWILRLQETALKPARPVLVLPTQTVALPLLSAGSIQSYLLQRRKDKWQASLLQPGDL